MIKIHEYIHAKDMKNIHLHTKWQVKSKGEYDHPSGCKEVPTKNLKREK